MKAQARFTGLGEPQVAHLQDELHTGFEDGRLQSSLTEDTTLKHAAAASRALESEARSRADISFPSMTIAAELYGEYDSNIIYIEGRLGVAISARGCNLMIEGAGDSVIAAESLLRDLYRHIECGTEIDAGFIDGQIRALGNPEFRSIVSPTPSNVVPQVSIKTRKKTISPRTAAQASYILAMQRNEMIFGLGPAGTGKTYLAVAQAVSQLITGEVDRLILSRPAVEAGERLGFLPGDMKEKVDPYLRPIYDALNDCLPPEQVEKRIASGEIEVAPIAFMRGRTLARAFIILDEAQNTTPAQMKMFLTRFGEGSRMVICGDPNQCDLPATPARNGQPAIPAVSGLNDAVTRLEGVEGIHMARFSGEDVVRHSIVGRIVNAYEG